VGLAFALVGVEERVVGAAQYGVELEGDVLGVADARAHALPEEGGIW
jgi:hypothetical protein